MGKRRNKSNAFKNQETRRSDRFNLAAFIKKPPAFISIDIETTGLEVWDGIACIAFAWSNQPPKSLTDIQSKAFHVDRYYPHTKKSDHQVREVLKATLFNPDYKGQVIFHNANFDLPRLIARYFSPPARPGAPSAFSRFLRCAPARPENYLLRTSDFCTVYDSMALSRSLKQNKYVSHLSPKMERCHSLKYLSWHYLKIKHDTFEDVIGGGNIRTTDFGLIEKYNRRDTELTLLLFFVLKDHAQKRRGEWEYFVTDEMPFTMGVIALNHQGVGFDAKRAKNWAIEIRRCMVELANEIFSIAGRSFDLDSQPELAKAIFRNPNVRAFQDEKLQPLLPQRKTGTGKIKVDTESLAIRRVSIEAIDPESLRARHFLNQVIKYLELSQAYSDIEKLERAAEQMPDGHFRIFATFTADAKTGRVKCGGPNILGLAKAIFDNAEIDGKKHVDNSLVKIRDEFKSVRSLICTSNSRLRFLSSDISGLDIGCIAAELLRFRPNTVWARLFHRHKVGKSFVCEDIHGGLLRETEPEQFAVAIKGFSSKLSWKHMDFLVTKETEDSRGRKVIHFIHAATYAVKTVYTAKSQTAMKALKQVREGMKTLNFAIPYNLGPVQLALKLTKVFNRWNNPIKEAEAKKMLERYHATFPEIRQFQDEVAAAVYNKGYFQTPFGRVIYADVWDELNECYSLNEAEGKPGIYEFVIFSARKTLLGQTEDGHKTQNIAPSQRRYWHVRAEGWLKPQDVTTKNFRLQGGVAPFVFRRILSLREIDSYTFRKKKMLVNYSPFAKKTESNLEEQSEYEQNLFAISFDIDTARKFAAGANGTGSWTLEAEDIRDGWVKNGAYQLPEKDILFYRVTLRNPSSKYFHKFRSFRKVAKPFFPLVCQAIAACVAKRCMNEIQKRLEKETWSATIALFVHDQYVVQMHSNEMKKVRRILKQCIESAKKLYDGRDYPIQFTGETKGPSDRYSFS